jgi:hypothetical protein
MQFQPAIPTRGTKVPATPDWIHEVKYDGFRVIVHRDGDRVRLLTRNGHDWSGRYPWIVESAALAAVPTPSSRTRTVATLLSAANVSIPIGAMPVHRATVGNRRGLAIVPESEARQ